jgi:hypothetical protein
MQRNIVVTVAIIAAMAASASSAQTLKFGFMAPMSGPSASSGQEMKRGLDLALEKFNNRVGGLETQSIADDKGSPIPPRRKLRASSNRKDRRPVRIRSDQCNAGGNRACREGQHHRVGLRAGTGSYAGKDATRIFLTGF